jgi:hypothetical protein
MYRIVRFFFRGNRRIIQTGLTLAEVQEHCDDPESSSTTATNPHARKRTTQYGPWFDGYEQEPTKRSYHRRKEYGRIYF